MKDVLQKVNSQDPTPKYVQAREILLGAIRSGRLLPGSKLPSTAELSRVFDVSLITAHRALEGLVETGWLRREVGRGTYVREDCEVDRAALRPLAVNLILEQQEQVNINDYYHGTLINALRRCARADKKHSTEFLVRDRYTVRRRSGRNAGAVCIHPPLERQGDVERLSHRYPTVVLGGRLPEADVTCVDCDNQHAARQAVRHLIDLGHDRIAVLCGPLNLSNSRDRTRGALLELRAAGIELQERDRLVSGDSTVLDPDTRTRLERRLRQEDRPTAILAGGFYLAMAAMQVVGRLGMAIPDDVSLVAFDDPPSAALLHPPLTTVRQPLDRMAAAAYQRITQAIVSGQAHPHCVRLKGQLVVRESTAPPPQCRA